MACIEKLAHSCGTSDALQVFLNDDGSYSGFCFRCNTYVPFPYGEGQSTTKKIQKKARKEEYEEVLAQILELPILDIPHRKLELETCKYFGIRTALSERDGWTPTAYFYPYKGDGGIIGFKVKTPDKQIFSIPTISGAKPFGWFQAISSGSRKLFITTGEDDTAALWQAIKHYQRGGKWEHLVPAVISVKNGDSGAAKEIGSLLSEIRKYFQEVVLVFDQDESGKRATEAVLNVLPTSTVAHFGEKDANAMLVAGKGGALAQAALFQASKPKNTRLVWINDVVDNLEPPQYGLNWPWEGMTKLTRGIRTGEVIYIGAGVKMGKGEVRNTLITHLAVNYNLKCFVASPEESNLKTKRLLLGKIAGKKFHDPTIDFDEEAYKAAQGMLANNVCVLDLYQNIDWNILRSDIQVAAAEGCKAVFIDPITNLTDLVDAGEANILLQKIAQEYAVLSKDLDLYAFMFCHLKEPTGGPPHERGGLVQSAQFRGSRAMMQKCNYMIGIEGNKDPELEPEQRNVRKLVLLEDREFGESGYVRLYWNRETSLFTEIKE